MADCAHVLLTVILRLHGSRSALITSYTFTATPVLQAVPEFPVESQGSNKREEDTALFSVTEFQSGGALCEEEPSNVTETLQILKSACSEKRYKGKTKANA